MNIIDGNLLDADTKYIVHQCNCVTNKAAHLAADMFERYPYADIYTGRTKPSIPGSIIIKGNGIDERFVINLLGQYYPGLPKFHNSKLDGFESRKRYFFQGLKSIIEIPNLESIAFPWGIGCCAAGGDWDFYLSLLEKFDKYIDADLLIYRLK